MVIAHNGKAYDHMFLQQFMREQGIEHNVIYAGSKMIEGRVSLRYNIRLIDSINFLPLPPSKLPAAFGLQGMRKGDFSHLFNKPENQIYIGPYYDASYYKSANARKELMDWL